MSGTISSAAALGVGARRSATKSQIVKSISCPTADTTGTETSAIVRATISSLNSHKSSRLPPPRATTTRSRGANRSLGVASSRIATAISCAAPLPWTRTGLIKICNHGARRRRTLRISRIAAPPGEVTMPMRRGNFGSDRFRSGANKPSASSLRLSASNRACNTPSPRGCRICTLSWYWPRASNTVTVPNTCTCAPSASPECVRGNGASVSRQIMHEICARWSLSVKYWCPLGCSL